MTRRAWTTVAVVLTLATWTAVTASATLAAGEAGKACPSFTARKWQAAFGHRSGTWYRWSVVGTGFTCKTAKPWVTKLLGDHVRRAPANGSNVPLKNGPKGYHCYATLLDKKGYAYLGICFEGTLAFPKSGFQWAGG